MDDDSPLVARVQRPRVLDSWSPAPLRVKTEGEQGYSGESRANGNGSMLLNRWRELGQERSVDSNSSPTALQPSSFGSSHSETIHKLSTRITESDRDQNPNYTLKMSVNEANGHITIARSPSSTHAHLSPVVDSETASGSSYSRADATNPSGPSPADLPLSPITENADEDNDEEEIPQIFLGVVFGVIPSQWYRKSLEKWHSGVETLGGRFISPSDNATPDVLLLPLSDERSNLVTPIEDTVPEQWRTCPLAVTSWITQCVMSGRLLEVHDPEVQIAGLDPLAIRLLEQRKARPTPAVAQSSSSSLDSSTIDQISTTLTELGATVLTQNTAFRAFVDGQGALQTQVKQMASAVTALAEQMNSSHRSTTQRVEQLSELIKKTNRYLNDRNRHGSQASSGLCSTTMGRPRTASFPAPSRDSFVPQWLSQRPAQRLGAEHRQAPRPVTHQTPPGPAGTSVSSLSGMLPTPPDPGPLTKLPDPAHPGDRRPMSPSQERQVLTVDRKQETASNSRAAECSLINVENGQTGAAVNDPHHSECLQYPNTPDSQADNARAAPLEETQSPSTLFAAPGAIPIPHFNADTMISPTDLQDLLRNVFSNSPMKGQELFWRKSRNIYIEHLGSRAPRRTCISHISDVSKVFPRRYMYDKIIFVSTSPKDPPLSVLFDMKEKEVVIYDTVDRYRNNLFTFANEKKVAEQFGLKDAPWYVVELVAKIGKDDAFSLVCLATKIFACRDRKAFRDLFPPHIVVAKKNIKNPIPPRRQAKADYYWRHVRPRVVKHLMTEMSAVLITRYRHEQANWLEVPKCTEWMEGIIRFEDSEDAKELLPDSRHKRERSEDSRPVSRAGGNSLSPIVATSGQQKRTAEEALAEELAVKKQKMYSIQDQ